MPSDPFDSLLLENAPPQPTIVHQAEPIMSGARMVGVRYGGRAHITDTEYLEAQKHREENLRAHEEKLAKERDAHLAATAVVVTVRPVNPPGHRQADFHTVTCSGRVCAKETLGVATGDFSYAPKVALEHLQTKHGGNGHVENLAVEPGTREVKAGE